MQATDGINSKQDGTPFVKPSHVANSATVRTRINPAGKNLLIAWRYQAGIQHVAMISAAMPLRVFSRYSKVVASGLVVLVALLANHPGRCWLLIGDLKS